MRQVLVIGIEDFIGERVAAALAATDWATPVEAIPSPSGAVASGANRRRLLVDVTSADSLREALRGIDAVVNCKMGQPQSIAATASALAKAVAAAATPPLVVHVSSMSVYGAVNGPVVETATLNGELGPYAAAKVAAEASIGLLPRRVVLRPGCEYGPGGELWSGRVARWLIAHRLGDLGAAGDGRCNLLHVDDLCGAVLLSLRRPEVEGECFNLAIAHPPTWNEYFIRYARVLGAVPVLRMGARRLKIETQLLAPPLKVLEIAGRAAGLGRIAPTPIPPSMLALMRQEIILVSDKAHQQLGWSCKSLEQGLAEAAAAYAPVPTGQPMARAA